MRIVDLSWGEVLTKLPFSIGPSLGQGADGEVRELIGQPKKVIKLSVMYDLDYSGSFKNDYINKLAVYHKIMRDSPSCLVKLHDYGLIHFGDRLTEVGKQEYVVYYSVMEKLYSISEDESKVFHTIISHEDNNKIKAYSDKELNRILYNFRRGLDFSEEEVKLFHTNLKNCKFRHNDIAVRNIMKNGLGKFKLIDIDRVTYE